MLADVLSDPRQLGEPAAGTVLDDARALLEEAATEAGRLGCWTPDEPLRLAKGPVAWLLRCPRRAVAGAGTTTEAGTANLDDLVVGTLVDAGAKLAVLSARRQPVTVDDARAFLTAAGDTDVDQYLHDIGSEACARLSETAGERLGRLQGLWSTIDPAWWPRVEEPVRVGLADGAVTLGGRFDLLLGGPPTDRPALVVEVKSGRWHDSMRADAHFYGLLLALRDDTAPAAVLTIAAGDGATQLEPIRPAILGHTAERVAVALRTAGELAAGQPPEARPGDHCTFCPVRHDCPVAA